jgi:hypothetical protein
MSHGFFFTKVPLSLGGFLSHFLFYPFFRPFAVYGMFIILALVVSGEASGILAFLCMESFYMHSTTFVIS